MKKIPTDSFQFKIAKVNGKKTVELLSRPYNQQFLDNKTKEGDVGTLIITLKKPTRSEQQLRYYAVLIGFIADYTGYTWEECHDALMKLKWGTRKIKIGKDVVEVRKSISNGARFAKIDMIEQIEFAMEKCLDLGITVPSKYELGYTDN